MEYSLKAPVNDQDIAHMKMLALMNLDFCVEKQPGFMHYGARARRCLKMCALNSSCIIRARRNDSHHRTAALLQILCIESLFLSFLVFLMVYACVHMNSL